MSAAPNLESAFNFFQSLISHIQIHRQVLLPPRLNVAPGKRAQGTKVNTKLALPAGMSNQVFCSGPCVSWLLPAPATLVGYLANLPSQVTNNLRPFPVPGTRQHNFSLPEMLLPQVSWWWAPSPATCQASLTPQSKYIHASHSRSHHSTYHSVINFLRF